MASTHHDSPQDIEYVNIKAGYWIWIDSLWKVESVTATTHQDEEVLTLKPIPSLETVDGHDKSIIIYRGYSGTVMRILVHASVTYYEHDADSTITI